MNFIADENVERQVVARLRQDGHQVFDVANMDPGISDDEVLSLANESQAVLLTADQDFGELVFRQGRSTMGIVLIRLAGLHPEKKAALVSSMINMHEEEIRNSFSVITSGLLRIRKLIPH